MRICRLQIARRQCKTTHIETIRLHLDKISSTLTQLMQ